MSEMRKKEVLDCIKRINDMLKTIKEKAEESEKFEIHFTAKLSKICEQNYTKFYDLYNKIAYSKFDEMSEREKLYSIISECVLEAFEQRRILPIFKNWDYCILVIAIHDCINNTSILDELINETL